MANYTMEIRELMNEPLISGVFTFDYPFYSDNQLDKEEFENLFIDYFYFREIGFETPDRFKMKLKAKLELIMPYYRQLAMTEWNKVKNAELMMNSKNLTETTTHEQTIAGSSDLTQNNTSSLNQTSETSTSQTMNDQSKASNLSDGVASVTLETGYLTGVSPSDNTTTQSNSNKGQQSSSNNGTSSTNSNQILSETTTFTSKGDIGIQTPAYAITEWRKVIININEMILKECDDLFMKLF